MRLRPSNSIIALLLLIGSASFPVYGASLPHPPPDLRDTPAPAEQKLSTLPMVFVRQFTFTGNSVVTTEELAAIATPYTGRDLAMEQLEELRQALIAVYVRKGYINSGVLIPDQQVRDGIINLTVIEGRLTSVQIIGLKHFRESYLSSRVGKGSGEPLNLDRLQQSLQLLQQDSRIRRINAELQPGQKPGEAELKVKIEEESPYRMALRFHNDASPSTGPYRGELALAHRNLLGFGDILSADAGLTEGAFDFGAGYSLPVTSRDTTISVSYRQNESDVIQEQYNDIDITSRSRTIAVKLRHPFYRTATTEIALSAAGEYRESKSWLLGRPFSFSLGEHDGVARVSVIRLGQEFVRRDNRYVAAFNSTFNVGMSAFGSTINKDEPDSRFFSWLGQILLLSRLGQTPAQIMFRTNLQFAADGLLSLERFGLGGMNSVRGYRPNILVRDNGVNSSLELRFPLFSDEQGWGTLQCVPFYDFGWGRNTDYPTPDPDQISSVGAGIRWSLRNRYSLEAFYGQSLRNVTVDSKELADRGVHFLLTAEVF